MNIVLVQAPNPSSLWNTQSFPPLGLLYVAASVKHLSDVSVALLDAGCEGISAQETAARVLRLNPDIVGVAVTSANFDQAA